MIVKKEQTLGGGTENNRRGRLLKHTNEFTQQCTKCKLTISERVS